ncbi:DNA alkylation repair protein [Zhouia spongiae]|uniref:DNA alkylation repair protein n=1 Tax=Zhouia spongiae TaxID=2202721 RepID=A0ABY3YNZ8_9FLAO|nr:DNA alkylation repair protein [Zhouia spongiae]UNY99554.1 DNA alkylation repair protein [Zhouia spongiae]
MSTIIEKVRSELQKSSTVKDRESGYRFFREEIRLYGVKAAVVRKISKEYFKEIKAENKETIFKLCETLWQSGMMEESFIACHWSYYIHKQYEPKDFKIFKKWVNTYVNNWASCDTLCNHTIGTFIEMFPEYIEELKQWTTSKNRWMRRAVAVSLIVPARKGEFLEEVFEIADTLLPDQDYLVQKGYGWLLKVASQVHQRKVFEYVMSKKDIMPRTSLRYAIEKMTPERKKQAMKKD